MSRPAGKILFAFALAGLVIWASPHGLLADEHASHHAGGFAGSMGGEMGGGMEGEHGRSRIPFYPSLMNLPSLTPQERTEIDEAAQSRLDDGAQLMSKGVDLLSNPNDYAAMREGTRLIREGLDEFQSGLAAREALTSGAPPQSVALQWFRQQTNLPLTEETGLTILGLSPFHFFSMALLIAFGAATLWIYFLRMRRARALMVSLASAGSAPPGGGPVPPRGEPFRGPPPPVPPAQGPPPTTAATDGGAEEKRAESEQPTLAKPARWHGTLRVLRTFDETPEVRTFRLGAPDGAPLPFTYLPGQFLDLTVTIDGKAVKRSYSIASSPTERDYAEITIKREPLGVMSGYLHERLKEGEELDIAAPAGRFTFTGTEAGGIVLIGGGVGITPLISVIRYLTAHGWPGEIVLLYCFRQPQDFIFREELEYLQRRNPNLRVIAAVTRRSQMPWIGLEGRFTKEIIAYSLPKIAAYRIHLCGPPPMMEAIRGMLLELGVAKDQIKTEAFGTDQRKPAGAARPATGIAAIDAPSTAAQRVNGSPRAAVRAARTPAVAFTFSGKSAPMAPGRTLLEAAENAGVNIDYSCRVGTCGTCKTKLVSGSVTMEVEEGLDPGEKEQGWILACQAKATADIAVEA
jgi:ferredoxin-NADP reductase